MSHSVPSEGSAIDPTFLVGAELVEFDHRELPIYLTPQARWMDACYDEAPYGAPLDRVFGEPGDVHIDGIVLGADELQAGASIVGDDPLVSLAALADGLILAPTEAAIAPELATQFDFGADVPVIHLHDSAGWDVSGVDATFDYLA